MEAIEYNVFEYKTNSLDNLFSKLDEALDDVENGRVQTIEEAWKEIDEL